MPFVFLSQPSSVLPCSSRHAYPAQAFPQPPPHTETWPHGLFSLLQFGLLLFLLLTGHLILRWLVTHLSEIISPDWPPPGRTSTTPLRGGSCVPALQRTFGWESAYLALLRWTYLEKMSRIRLKMEKSHSCWPRTVWCVVNMFHKNRMRSLIIATGRKCYSILYCNLPWLYIRLKCMYSVISVIVDSLPGNSKK